MLSLTGLASRTGKFPRGGKCGDELMSAISFWITPKGDIPHYSYILRNPEPLGVDLKKAACYWLWIMLCLEIQNKK